MPERKKIVIKELSDHVTALTNLKGYSYIERQIVCRDVQAYETWSSIAKKLSHAIDAVEAALKHAEKL